MADNNNQIFPLASEDLNKKLHELVHQCSQYKKVKRATKALNRGQAEIIVLAADADPIEIVLHLPLLCEDKNVPHIFVPSKQALGRSCGISRSVIACALLCDENNNLKNTINDLKDKIERLMI